MSEQWHQTLVKMPDAKRVVADLHLPVGGRRFRPSLEDIIEFLIVEKIAAGRAGWEQRVNATRDSFQERQLRAAIRRNPDVAANQLAKMDYDVKPPPL